MARCNQPEIQTFGCRLNIWESEVMREQAGAAGLQDAIIFNTCAVTAEAERQARQAIRKAYRENPDVQIIVTGCAAQIDPDTGGQTPVVSKIFSIFLTVLFLSWNGHLVVLRTILDTYQFMPVGTLPNIDALVAGGLTAAGSMFFAATIIMLPITGFLVAINLAVGVISRSSPQMNLFAIGFPISMIVIFILLYMWVDALGHSLIELSQTAVESVAAVLGTMING